MNKLGEDDAKAMSHEKIESRYRLNAGIVAFWGTVADLTGQGVAKASSLIPKVAKGLAFLGRVASFGGRLFGIVGAGMVAYWDGKAGVQAFREKKFGLAALYFSSALLGVASAGLIIFAATFAWAGPLALIFIGLLIAVAVLIEYFKDNKIQEWMNRCWWGNGPDAIYPDVQTELSQLKLAVA